MDLDVAADIGSATGDRAVLTEGYEIKPNTARILDLDTGRDLFGELQPFTDCVCQIGNTAITPDGTSPWAGCRVDRLSEAITDRGRVAVWDTDTGRTASTIDTPWEPDGMAITPDGERVLVNGFGGGASRHRVGRGAVRSQTRTDVSITGLRRARRCRPTVPRWWLRGETVIVLDPASGDVLVSDELAAAGNLDPGSLHRRGQSHDGGGIGLREVVLPRRRDVGAGGSRPTGHRGVRHRPPDEP